MGADPGRLDLVTAGQSITWRPSYRAPNVVHAALDGQTRRTSPGSQLRWVWALCAEHVDPDGVERPGSVRCPECVAWVAWQAQHAR